MPIDNHICITAHTQFLREHSDPSQQRYAFSYTITISNLGTKAARLLTRHWIITDANGHTQEVHGEGVVGEQPLIQPGAELSLYQWRYFIHTRWYHAWHLYDVK